MKRDWDLIRDQLLAIEEGRDFRTAVIGIAGDPEPEWKDGQTEAEFKAVFDEHKAAEERILGHLQLLLESGYIDGVTVGRSLSGEYYYAVSRPRLTMAGHDLLDTIRSRPLWEKITSTAKTKGLELTADVIKALAGTALKALVG
jgi:hypothetical protein